MPHPRPRLCVPAAAAFLLAVLGGGAWAQSPGGFTHDPDQPIELSADELEVREDGNTAIFRGSVEAVQGDLALSADEIRVYYRSGGNDGLITRIDANGDVSITTPEETANGDWAIYDVDQRIVTLGGAVTIKRGENTLNGQRLVVDLQGGGTKLDGAGPDSGRVRGVFRPSDGEGGSNDAP